MRCTCSDSRIPCSSCRNNGILSCRRFCVCCICLNSGRSFLPHRTLQRWCCFDGSLPRHSAGFCGSSSRFLSDSALHRFRPRLQFGRIMSFGSLRSLLSAGSDRIDYTIPLIAKVNRRSSPDFLRKTGTSLLQSRLFTTTKNRSSHTPTWTIFCRRWTPLMSDCATPPTFRK